MNSYYLPFVAPLSAADAYSVQHILGTCVACNVMCMHPTPGHVRYHHST